jgi:hypothetical protein
MERGGLWVWAKGYGGGRVGGAGRYSFRRFD